MQSKIRNFSIIAHIDHGKSTLADRMLELAGMHSSHREEERIMDRLALEQEKGITIKLQPARLHWKGFQLNIIDTPGHVDFSYEVSRSLAACEGAVLLVDASQGVQAQTIATTKLARKYGLVLIPALNKVDLPNINIEMRKQELVKLLGFDAGDILMVSGKTGLNVDALLDAIIERVPAPEGDATNKLQALVFDSVYNEHKGVIVAIKVINGRVEDSSTELFALASKKKFKPAEIGFFIPEMVATKSLECGEVGYIATGEKDIRDFLVGDTIGASLNTKLLPGYTKPKANVFATVFPVDPNDFEELKKALGKLSLNDASLTISEQRSTLLGAGFRCGLLGLLHMEILQERLEREFGLEIIVTAPNVEYRVVKTNGDVVHVQTPNELPGFSEISEILEPWVRMQIFTPSRYIGDLMELCQLKRGSYVDTKYLNGGVSDDMLKYVILEYDMPLASLISNFFSQLKSLSSGYASMEYEFVDFFPVDLVKVSILVNKVEVPALNFLETREHARKKAVALLESMKKVIPRQQFQVPLQAAIGSKIIARENIKAYRKDVTAKLYGGDYSRKKKLLEKQKKGKKRLKQIGSVDIPQEAFLAILKT